MSRAERQWSESDDRRCNRHEDRSQAVTSRLDDRVAPRQSLASQVIDMIDQHDPVVHNHTDQDHDSYHRHERERRSGRSEEQEYAEDREQDRAQDDRERQQQ